jgi:uncharacterized protein YozE (UPF0346 family)
MNNRRKFLKGTLAASSLLVGNQLLGSPRIETNFNSHKNRFISELDEATFNTPNIMQGMPIKATFLDEISWDIPHQNWGVKDWDQDFKAMKAMGINTVVMIRSGLGKWIASDFKCLLDKEEVYYPPVDLVKLFLTLADKYNLDFYFGMYDSGRYWQQGLFQKEIDLNMSLIDEVWEKYGHHKSFKGWYLSQEISRRTKNMSKIYAKVGKHAKTVSGNLTTLVSPYIHGVKTDQVMSGDKAISVKEHEKEWDEILGNVEGAVDILAFQDGQVDYHELYDYLVVNKKLAHKHGMKCWTNIESFDRDMPIRFLPIKWEKLLLKLEAARKAGMENAITFEFSHFMSPNSAYLQAGHLYDRYKEHFNIK